MDPDALRGGHLLGPAQGRHLRPGEVLVEAAGVAVGHHAVDHLDPGFCPVRDGSRGTEVHIVGVGRDGQHPANLGVIEHARHPSRGPVAAWRDTRGLRRRVGYSSGTRVGVALVRVSFLKKGAPGATNRQ
jgi:hypothetical protein